MILKLRVYKRYLTLGGEPVKGYVLFVKDKKDLYVSASPFVIGRLLSVEVDSLDYGLYEFKFNKEVKNGDN